MVRKKKTEYAPDSVFGRIEAAKAQLKDVTEQLKKNNRSLLMKEAFTGLFEAFPGVESLQWNQYTPSFNDGDPCRFTRGEVYAYMKDETEGDEYDMKGNPEALKAISALEDILDTLGDDMLADLFGDDKKIKVSSTGFDIDYYECGY